MLGLSIDNVLVLVSENLGTSGQSLVHWIDLLLVLASDNCVLQLIACKCNLLTSLSSDCSSNCICTSSHDVDVVSVLNLTSYYSHLASNILNLTGVANTNSTYCLCS